MARAHHPSMTTTDHAACATEDPELFFVPDGRVSEDGEHSRVAAAKQVCARCLIRESCLTDNWTDPFGIFGGTTPEERRRHDRQREGGTR